MELLLPKLGLFVWTMIAFLLAAFILKKFAWKPILKALNDRETNIANSIAAAENMKAEMRKMEADNSRLLAEAREERSQLLKEARDASEKMIAEAKDKAKSEAEKIMQDTRLQIQQEKNRAMTEVKNEIGALSLGVAEKILRKELSSSSSQNNYIDELVKDIKLN